MVLGFPDVLETHFLSEFDLLQRLLIRANNRGVVVGL